MYEYSTCADLVTNIIDSSGLEVNAYYMIVLYSLYIVCLRINSVHGIYHVVNANIIPNV